MQKTSEDAGISQAQIGQLCYLQVNLCKVRSPCCSVKTDFGAADVKKGCSVSNGAQFAWKVPQEGTPASVKGSSRQFRAPSGSSVSKLAVLSDFLYHRGCQQRMVCCLWGREAQLVKRSKQTAGGRLFGSDLCCILLLLSLVRQMEPPVLQLHASRPPITGCVRS